MYVNLPTPDDNIQVFVVHGASVKAWKISSAAYLKKLANDPQVYLNRRRSAKSYLGKTYWGPFLVMIIKNGQIILCEVVVPNTSPKPDHPDKHIEEDEDLTGFFMRTFEISESDKDKYDVTFKIDGKTFAETAALDAGKYIPFYAEFFEEVPADKFIPGTLLHEEQILTETKLKNICKYIKNSISHQENDLEKLYKHNCDFRLVFSLAKEFRYR